MKKVLMIAAAALFIGSTASAQDVMKQTGGEQNFEVLFAPLGGSPIGIDGIKYRSFTSANTAFRLTAFIGFGTDVTTNATKLNGKDVELKSSKSHFDISLQPGLEWHLGGTDRISPYYGAEAIVAFSKSGSKADTPYGSSSDYKKITTLSKGNFGLGVNAFAGVDYYIANNLYLGAEFGFGVMFRTDLKSKSEALDFDGNVTTVEDKGGKTSINLGPTVVGALRLGLLF